MKRNKFGQKQEWVNCERCGTGRWVIIIRDKPVSKICRACHIKDLTGKNSPKFNEGQTILKGGYVGIRQPDHPKANYNGYVPRARLVLEKKLGRYLLPGYEFHHLNNNKTDDRPANLIELSKSAHATITNHNRKVLSY